MPKTRGEDQRPRPACLFLRTSAAHTANAMKKPEVIRIAVFAVPSGMLSWFDADDEGVVVPVAVQQVRKEQPAEEHDFGEQEEPHAEAARLALLLHRLEVMTVLGQRARARARHAQRFRACADVWSRRCYPTVVTSFFCLVLEPLVVVGFVVHDRHLDKVLGQRRRLNLPLKAGRLPRIVARNRAILQRPAKVEQRQHVADAKHRRARGREHVQHLDTPADTHDSGAACRDSPG